MLAQNINDKYDQLINYALKLLNNVEQNYKTIKREALVMVYTLHRVLCVASKKKGFSHPSFLHFIFAIFHSSQVFIISFLPFMICWNCLGFCFCFCFVLLECILDCGLTTKGSN